MSKRRRSYRSPNASAIKNIRTRLGFARKSLGKKRSLTHRGLMGSLWRPYVALWMAKAEASSCYRRLSRSKGALHARQLTCRSPLSKSHAVRAGRIDVAKLAPRHLQRSSVRYVRQRASSITADGSTWLAISRCGDRGTREYAEHADHWLRAVTRGVCTYACRRRERRRCAETSRPPSLRPTPEVASDLERLRRAA